MKMLCIVSEKGRCVCRWDVFINFSERYFQCEPMDATVSPVELTNNPQGNTGDNRGHPASVDTADNSAENSNPGTPINK